MRSNRPDAETAALLALMQGQRPSRSRGAARTPGRDARLGTIGGGDRRSNGRRD
jgi:hypothetical protein